MLTVLSVFGTRPEAIKLAPVILEFAKYPAQINSVVCITAQHRQMLDQVLQLFNINPAFDLNLMQPDQSLTQITSRVLYGLRDILQQTKPQLVLVHGDTTTTLAASLAAFYEKVPVGHVEAGLRTGNIYAPWPEEMNRRLTDTIAYLHFAPTQWARQNLLQEGFPTDHIHVTGNTVIDALFEVITSIKTDVTLQNRLTREFAFLDPQRKLVLVTGHRRENFGPRFFQFCQALKQLSQREDVQIVYPVHLNPNVREPVHQLLDGLESIYLIEPQDYLQFVYLMEKSFLIITDSGGIQEEAPALGKPILVTRDVTERPEAVAAGAVKLTGVDANRIIREAQLLLDNPGAYKKMVCETSPYGDGLAAKRITEIILQTFAP